MGLWWWVRSRLVRCRVGRLFRLVNGGRLVNRLEKRLLVLRLMVRIRTTVVGFGTLVFTLLIC